MRRWCQKPIERLQGETEYGAERDRRCLFFLYSAIRNKKFHSLYQFILS